LVELGLGSPEEVVRLVLDGGLERHGRLPTNLDGGCIARGHPSGATALGQAADIVRQLRGSAGDRQVPGDVHTGVVQTMGGGGSAAVAVLRRQDA
jgi:acetyl-CoA acetyltransferase